MSSGIIGGSQQAVSATTLRVLIVNGTSHSVLCKNRRIWAPTRSKHTPVLCNLPTHVPQLVALAISRQHMCSEFELLRSLVAESKLQAALLG